MSVDPTRGDSRRTLLRWLERGLLALGLVCLGWVGVVQLRAAVYQRAHQDALEHLRAAAPAAPAHPPASLAAGAVVGSLEIPRLRVSAIVAEGDDDSTLKLAVGHLPETPLPWQAGNSALAGHRDTFFRPLEHLRIGDEIRFITPHGDFRYEVRSTIVVGPDDLWVLDPTDRPSMTLITCYPFDYIGRAPWRFIVRAERVPTPAGAEGPAPSPSQPGGSITQRPRKVSADPAA